MISTLSIVGAFILGQLVGFISWFYLAKLTWHYAITRNDTFKNLSKQYPYDWSQHCELCKKTAEIMERQKEDFEALLNDSTIYPNDGSPP